jgi:hypothetical protein
MAGFGTSGHKSVHELINFIVKLTVSVANSGIPILKHLQITNQLQLSYIMTLLSCSYTAFYLRLLELDVKRKVLPVLN